MENNLQEIYDDLLNDAKIRAESEGNLVAETLFDIFAESACECGEVNGDIEYAPYDTPGQKIDGYYYDDSNEVESRTLTLVIGHLYQDEMIKNVEKKEMEKFFRQAEKFIKETSDKEFLLELEESSSIWEVADILHHKQINRIRLLLLSNAKLTTRLTRVESRDVAGRHHSYHVLDLSKYAENLLSQKKREPIHIDFKEKESLHCLKTAETDTYSSYLVAVPGAVLATIYDDYGGRLLEQNVRTFLQAKGKVNRGIINTIKNEPEMFFAYNNGITATADDVKIKNNKIESINDLQIVNGGQTTASLLYARDSGECDLHDVYVQMKLSVIKKQDKLAEIVSYISRYANTQNKISEADLFANAPFHIRMEEFSRRIRVPSQAGEFKQTKWFYERARGQYKDAQFKKKKSEVKQFLTEYPRTQLFTKTDLAKYLMAHDGHPYEVAAGAQKNFQKFAKIITDKWNKSEDEFNEKWYKDAVAKAILFRETDKLAASIAKELAYDRGYKAHVTSYSVAFFAEYIKNEFEKFRLDLDVIWREQSVDENMQTAMHSIVTDVGKCLTEPQGDYSRLGKEWCKLKDCWGIVRKLEIDIPQKLVERYLIDKDSALSEERIAKKGQKIDNDLNAEMQCVHIGQEWGAIEQFAQENDIFVDSNTQKALKYVLANGVPNRVQAKFLMKLLDEAKEIGYKSDKIT